VPLAGSRIAPQHPQDPDGLTEAAREGRPRRETSTQNAGPQPIGRGPNDGYPDESLGVPG
jgi:hypothetical protein